MNELIYSITIEETSIRLERWATAYCVTVVLKGHLYCYLDESLEESMDMMEYILDLFN